VTPLLLGSIIETAWPVDFELFSHECQRQKYGHLRSFFIGCQQGGGMYWTAFLIQADTRFANILFTA